MSWSPEDYLRFADERTRPAAELLARVPVGRPRRVLDVGCGPGNSTALLAARYPEAEIVGLDSSPEMIAAARKSLPEAEFVLADIAAYEPRAAFDLVFANAVLHWVPDHAAVAVRLLAACPAGGALAFQVPDNLNEPAHMLMAAVSRGGRWREKFRTPVAREAILSPAAYYDRLAPLAAALDLWHTTYHHVLPDHDAILDWLAATGLRPWLDRLDEADRADWLAAYRERIVETHRPLSDGRVMLRFPRLFVVAVRG
jgi:trans-aconitate 2-methyltransferase